MTASSKIKSSFRGVIGGIVLLALFVGYANRSEGQPPTDLPRPVAATQANGADTAMAGSQSQVTPSAMVANPLKGAETTRTNVVMAPGITGVSSQTPHSISRWLRRWTRIRNHRGKGQGRTGPGAGQQHAFGGGTTTGCPLERSDRPGERRQIGSKPTPTR